MDPISQDQEEAGEAGPLLPVPRTIGREAAAIVVPRGLRCPFCHADVEPLRPDWVACAGCLARHHAGCWRDECASCRGRRALRPPRPRRSAPARTAARAWTPWLVAASLLVAWRADARPLPLIKTEPEVGLAVRFEPPARSYTETMRCGPPAREELVLEEVASDPAPAEQDITSCPSGTWQTTRGSWCLARRSAPACCASTRRPRDGQRWQHASRFRAARDLITLARHAEALALLRENIAESPHAVDIDEAHAWAAVCEAAVGDVRAAIEHVRALGGGRRWDARRTEVRLRLARRSGPAVDELDRLVSAARSALLASTRDLVRQGWFAASHLRDQDHLDALAELVETGALRLSGER